MDNILDLFESTVHNNVGGQIHLLEEAAARTIQELGFSYSDTKRMFQ